MRKFGIRDIVIIKYVVMIFCLILPCQVVPAHTMNVQADETQSLAEEWEISYEEIDPEEAIEEEELWNPKVTPSSGTSTAAGGAGGRSKVLRKQLASSSAASVSYITSFGQQLADAEEYAEAYKLYMEMKSYYVDGMEGLTGSNDLNHRFSFTAGYYSFTAVLSANGTISYTGEDSYKEARARMTRDVQSAIDALDYDYPELYYQYADGYTIHFARDTASYKKAQQEIEDGAETAELTYSFAGVTTKYKEAYEGALETVGTWRSALAVKAAEISAAAEDIDHDGSISTEELVKGINDYLCDRFYYDNSRLASYLTTKDYQIFGTSAAVFDDTDMGVVCEGYSRSMLAFCRYFDIPCCLIAGNKTSTSGHMWNAVQIDGVWYLIDVTWNDSYGSDSKRSYRYLLRETMSNHVEDGRFSKSTVDSFTFAYPVQTDTSYWPRIQSDRLAIGRKKVSAGSKTILSIRVDDVSEVSSVKAVYLSPDTAEETDMDLNYNEGTHTYQAVITVDENTELGTWQLQSISVTNELALTRSITADQMDLAAGSYTVVSTCGEDGHNLIEYEAVTAACIAEGRMAYWECNVCGKYFADIEALEEIEEGSWVLPIDETHHGEHELRNAVSATCTEEGWSGDIYCVDCGQELESGSMISALGHTLKEHEAADATCITEGRTSYWECSICGKYFADINALEEIEEGSWVLPIDETHHGEHELRNAVSATCTEEGWSGEVYCVDCGQELESGNMIPALGHTLKEHEAVDATCITEGRTSYWECSLCGKYFADIDALEEIEEGSWVLPIDETHHGEHELRNAVSATCTEEGWSGDIYCVDCGQELESGYGTPAPGHDLIKYEAVLPTETAEGSNAYWECSVCGKYFGDETASNEIEENSWVIKKTNQNQSEDNENKSSDPNDSDKGQYSNDSGSEKENTSADIEKNQTAVVRFRNTKPKITGIKGRTRKITLRWKKVSDAEGYEIRYSLKKNMKSSKKVTVKASKLTRNIKKLRSGRNYYVRIRAYRIINGKKVYSRWSAKKRVFVR